MHGDHVGVIEPRHGLRLAGQSLGASRALLGSTAGMQQLECDPAVELGVVGGVDQAHRARAQTLEHDVAIEGVAALELPYPRNDLVVLVRHRLAHVGLTGRARLTTIQRPPS